MQTWYWSENKQKEAVKKHAMKCDVALSVGIHGHKGQFVWLNKILFESKFILIIINR